MSGHVGPAYDNRRRLGIAFGEALRAARCERGVSQEWLALATGLDRTFMSLLERGGRTPTLLVVFLLADALSTFPSTLVADTFTRFYYRLSSGS
jgi:transcriptional regulator with XRE-family HTH domain